MGVVRPLAGRLNGALCCQYQSPSQLRSKVGDGGATSGRHLLSKAESNKSLIYPTDDVLLFSYVINID